MDHEAVSAVTTSSSVWTTLAPVITGGMLAIGGALTGSLLAYFLNQRTQRKTLKREKLEQLLCAGA